MVRLEIKRHLCRPASRQSLPRSPVDLSLTPYRLGQQDYRDGVSEHRPPRTSSSGTLKMAECEHLSTRAIDCASRQQQVTLACA